MIEGSAVTVGGNPVRGGLSPDEWASLSQSAGTPRYFQLSAGKIYLYPHPTQDMTVSYTFQSKNWTPSGASWGADTETAFVPEDLIEMGAIWRWKRHIGASFEDYLSEFESALADRAKFDGGVRLP
jgi:hypothetical protein